MTRPHHNRPAPSEGHVAASPGDGVAAAYRQAMADPSPDATSRARSASRRETARGRSVRVRSAGHVPMSAEQHQAAVEALTALALWWLHEGRGRQR